jgi:hypothetical protein
MRMNESLTPFSLPPDHCPPSFERITALRDAVNAIHTSDEAKRRFEHSQPHRKRGSKTIKSCWKWRIPEKAVNDLLLAREQRGEAIRLFFRWDSEIA